jgi:hypothetical protein
VIPDVRETALRVLGSDARIDENTDSQVMRACLYVLRDRIPAKVLLALEGDELREWFTKTVDACVGTEPRLTRVLLARRELSRGRLDVS